MKRITSKYSDGTPFVPNWFKQLHGKNYENEIAKKLAKYEDLEEQESKNKGILVKLP